MNMSCCPIKCIKRLLIGACTATYKITRMVGFTQNNFNVICNLKLKSFSLDSPQLEQSDKTPHKKQQTKY